MHLFSALHSGCNPPRVPSGCSRNRVIYSTYFGDCLGYTDTLTCYILKSIIGGLRWTFLFVSCDIWLQPVQLLGYLDFPYDANRTEGEGESILCVASETGKQNYKPCIVGWAESILRVLEKGVQMFSQFLILNFTGFTRREEFLISFPKHRLFTEVPCSLGTLVFYCSRRGAGSFGLMTVQPTSPGTKRSAGWPGSSPPFLS